LFVNNLYLRLKKNNENVIIDENSV